ncbi:neuroguidin [Dermacentor andersoni]|uniref:neuroguidin n=1 Tax=Dermacentor andersoni TaxID=34620 RepID=UPI002155C34A|nr:neuroguidin-like [Dermacentor andersoni]
MQAVQAVQGSGSNRVDMSQVTISDRRHEKEVPEFLTSLKEVKDKASGVSAAVESLLSRVKNKKELNTAAGLSFLEMKNHVMLGYLLDLTHIVWCKVSGKRISGDPSIRRLVQARTVLERIRPIDQKLKYQVDKVVRTATLGTLNSDDPLRFRANPAALEAESGDESTDSVEKGAGDKVPKVYRPPKLAPVHYDGDETEKERRERLLERAKRKALCTSVMEELRSEFYDGPIEIKDAYDSHKAKQNKAVQERVQYEEDNMLRLTLTKKERNLGKQLGTMSSLRDLTRFGDFSALDANDADDLQPPKKKTKKVYKKKWGKKGFRKGRR